MIATPIPVSVLVPTVGRRDLLGACLRSVLACDPAPDEVVVVDQSHGDGVAAALDELHPTAVPVRRVVCDGRGTARAMNRGLAEVAHDTVLVTHDDCTVDPGWVGEGRRLAGAHPGAIITGRVLAPDGSRYVPSTKADPRPRDYTGTVTTGVLYPANMVASRRALQALGGFDERETLLVAEDNDLCYRWLLAGGALRYEPSLVVWHHDWRDPPHLVRTHVAYARAQGGFYAKHLHDGDLRVLPLLRWDVKHAIRTIARGVARREPRWTDAYREMHLPLLGGFVAGWREARRLGRQRGAQGRG